MARRLKPVQRICDAPVANGPTDETPYEVSCLGMDENPHVRKVIGHTSAANGGSLYVMVIKHPSLHSPQVRDTRKK